MDTLSMLRTCNISTQPIKRFSDRIPDVPPQPYQRAVRDENLPLFIVMQNKERQEDDAK